MDLQIGISFKNGDPVSSKVLFEAGIPGIRYLDQGSRTGFSSVSRAQLDIRLKSQQADLVRMEREGVGMPDRVRQEISSLENEIKRLDNPTHNYVIFDESKIKITHENGQPVGTLADVSPAPAEQLQMVMSRPKDSESRLAGESRSKSENSDDQPDLFEFYNSALESEGITHPQAKAAAAMQDLAIPAPAAMDLFGNSLTSKPETAYQSPMPEENRAAQSAESGQPSPSGQTAEDYRISHRPMQDAGGASRLHDLVPAFGEDVYGKNALQYFGSGDPREAKTVRLLKQLRGNPEATVTIYRGVPKGVETTISKGDWVTLDRSVAEDYGKVLSKEVKAKDVTSWAD